LELFQRFLDVEVKDDTGSIDHTGTKEPVNKLLHAHKPNCRKQVRTIRKSRRHLNR
jgi:hypothetical protein